MYKVEEFQCHFFRWRREGTVDSAAVKVVNPRELMAKGTVEDTTTKAVSSEHAGDEGLELYVAVVELWWDRTSELELVGLETFSKGSAVRAVFRTRNGQRRTCTAQSLFHHLYSSFQALSSPLSFQLEETGAGSMHMVLLSKFALRRLTLSSQEISR